MTDTTKLTLSVNRSSAAAGKQFAHKVGRSLSSIVGNYLDSLAAASQPGTLSDDVSSLLGIGSGAADERDWMRHRESRQ